MNLLALILAAVVYLAAAYLIGETLIDLVIA